MEFDSNWGYGLVGYFVILWAVYASVCGEMQPRQSSRIDLAELKAQMMKKLGVDKFKRYIYYVERFINDKLSKPQFDSFCRRILGRENVPLHNHLFRSILMNW